MFAAFYIKMNQQIDKIIISFLGKFLSALGFLSLIAFAPVVFSDNYVNYSRLHLIAAIIIALVYATLREVVGYQSLKKIDTGDDFDSIL